MSSSAYNEKELLHQVSKGDAMAFRELFYRYADRLGSYVVRLTRSTMQAEEIVQDVFLKIWTGREALAGVDNFSVYLFIVARNQALNAMRKLLQQMDHQKKWEREQATAIKEDRFADDDQSIHLQTLMDGAINQLPSQQQKAWLLSRKEGLTHPQIAAVMGISRETVKKYIMYANQSISHFIRSQPSTPN